MKKFLACILALVMVFGLAINASAVDAGSTTIDVNGGSKPIGDVEVKVNKGDTINTYYVIVAWEALTFSYTANDKRWDAEKQTYVDAGGGTFSGTPTAKITVTNQSDVDITVTAAVADKDPDDGFVASLLDDKTTFDLDSYYGRGAGDADKNNFTITVATDGIPEASNNPIAVAGVTVGIAKKGPLAP